MSISLPSIYLNKLKELFASISHTHSGYAASNHTHSGYASSSHNHDSSYAAKSHTHTASQITDLPNSNAYYPHYDKAVQIPALSGENGLKVMFKTPCKGYLFVAHQIPYKQVDGDYVFIAGTKAALLENNGNNYRSSRIVFMGLVSNGDYQSDNGISCLIGANVYIRNANNIGSDHTHYNFFFIPAIDQSVSITTEDANGLFNRGTNECTGSPSLLN